MPNLLLFLKTHVLGDVVDLYPIRFQPLFQEYIWGGRRLGTELDKPVGDGSTVAESWEIVDHGDDQSVVRFGSFSGKTLAEMVRELGEDLLGKKTLKAISNPNRPENLRNRFPLLFKFLDANQNLSVQVHPDDQMGATLEEPDLGKTEAWVVMDALAGARVYVGLKEKVTQEDLKKAFETNSADSVLHSFQPQPGDCLFIPAGTVHALGAGLLIAEIQQCSNTTFRLYDWGRLGKDGKPRDLHFAEGLAAIDFSMGPVNPQIPKRIDEITELIVDCNEFNLKRIRLSSGHQFNTRGSFQMIAVTKGTLSIEGDPCEQPMKRGETCLIPACLGSYRVEAKPQTEFLLVSPSQD